MASRSLLKEIKAPLRFLLRNPSSSVPSARTIQNILLPIPRQSASGVLGEFRLSDNPQLSRVLNSTFDHGFRIEVRGKREPVIEEGDEFSENEADESDNDDGFSDEFSADEFCDDDDAEDDEK